MREIVLLAAMLALGGQLSDAPQQPQQATQIPDAPQQQTQVPGQVAPGKATMPPANVALLPAKPQDEETAPVTPANSQDIINNPLVLNVNAVEVPFTVKDKEGHSVPGITWRDVHVYENNVLQHATVFTVDPHPLSVAVVIDQSLGFHDMARVNNALGALQAAFAAYDDVAIVTYNNGPKIMTGFTGGQSARLGAVIELSKTPGREPLYYDASGPMARTLNINEGADDYINPLTSRGPASPQGVAQVPREAHPLNDAILMAAQLTAKAERGRRRIVYVISDGKEYGSLAKSREVVKYLQSHKVQVMATLVGDASVKGMGFVESMHLPLTMRDNILPVYTRATGGELYADYRSNAIADSFQKITDEARSQYTIWYNSREPLTDEKYRKVEVRVLRPNLQVIAKDGYFPSPQDATPRPVSGAVAPPR